MMKGPPEVPKRVKTGSIEEKKEKETCPPLSRGNQSLLTLEFL